MEIYVFNRDLELQGILENYFSLTWRRKYSQCGDFLLHAGVTEESLRLLQRGSVIWKNDSTEAAYIVHREISLDRLGQEVLRVRGQLLPGYLGQRIIWGTERFNGKAEMAIRTSIQNHAITPSNPDRVIPLFELGDIRNLQPVINVQSTYGNLLETVEKIANASELGFDCKLDYTGKRIIFDTYEGVDRTAGQSINAPAVFSVEFENVLEQSYTDSYTEYRNVGLVAGEGEGDARKIVSIGISSGLDRYEKYIDARDLSSDGMTEQEYESMLVGRGLIKLSECAPTETFEGRVNPDSNLIYKSDFDLGDIVTCASKKWSVTVDTRITEVEEVYENGLDIYVSFGKSMPTLYDKISEVVS